jgi:O-acetylserine/cysteine efflux transporter
MSPRDLCLAVIPPVCWGIGFTVAKPAVAHFPPLFMMLAIYAAIAAVLAATVHEPMRTSFARLSVIAAFGVTVQGAFLFMGLNGLPAGVATLVLQTQVPFAVVIGWLVGGEPFNLRKLIGTIVAVAGVVVVVGLPEETPPLLPVLFIVLGALFWATGQVLARGLGRDDGILQLKGLAVAGLPQLLLATIVLETGQLKAVTTAGSSEWAALVFVGVVGFYLPYVLWYALLRRNPVDDVVPFVLLMPVVGVITAAALLGEPILWTHIFGGALIIAGLAVITGLKVPRLRSV